jgi:hypothetical protein
MGSSMWLNGERLTRRNEPLASRSTRTSQLLLLLVVAEEDEDDEAEEDGAGDVGNVNTK